MLLWLLGWFMVGNRGVWTVLTQGQIFVLRLPTACTEAATAFSLLLVLLIELSV
jgi:hypothetical protein